MTTGERIKELRKQAGYTQKEFGKKINKSAQVISNWERGYTTGITENDISTIAAIFGVTTDYLLGRSDAPTKSTSKPATDAASEVFDDEIRTLARAKLKDSSPEQVAERRGVTVDYIWGRKEAN
jgi:transcriptional regulator with XRE-family HTH domain